MLNLGNLSIKDLFLGSTKVSSAWIGTQKVWPNLPNYLCFANVGSVSSTITLKATGNAPTIGLVISSNGESWTTLAPGRSFALAPNGKMYIRASRINSGFATSTSNYLSFTATGGAISVSGDATFALSPDGNVLSLPDYGLACMFRGNTSLVDASGLVLPFLNVANRSLFSMFRDCTSLVSAPNFAGTIASSNIRSMAQMYQNCSSLVHAPETVSVTSPVMAAASYTCLLMFDGCSSLAVPPLIKSDKRANGVFEQSFKNCSRLSSAEINFPVLTVTCLNQCFDGCSSLSSVKVNFTKWGGGNSTVNWLRSVSSSGTFYCPSGLDTSQRGNSTVPSGWTVINT